VSLGIVVAADPEGEGFGEMAVPSQAATSNISASAAKRIDLEAAIGGED
jgi:hypothetical protein